MKNCLLTLNVGNGMPDNTRASLQAAAARWACEYLEVTECLPGMKPWEMKLHCFDLCDADRVFYVDGYDTLIRADCPSPFETFPEDAFAATRNQQPHMPAGSYRACVDTFVRDISKIVERHGAVTFNPDGFICSGVWLASRAHHADVLRKAAEIVREFDGVTDWHDQSSVNYALLSAGTPVYLLPDEWGLQFPPDTESRPMVAYIYHYAGKEHLDRIPGVDWKAHRNPPITLNFIPGVDRNAAVDTQKAGWNGKHSIIFLRGRLVKFHDPEGVLREVAERSV